jgi:hypothetical protein
MRYLLLTSLLWLNVGATAAAEEPFAWPAARRIGSVVVTPVAASIKTAEVYNFRERRDEVTKDKFLILEFKVENLSTTERVDFSGWNTAVFDDQKDRAYDEYGNAYRNADFGFNVWLKENGVEKLKPGQSTHAKVALELPIASAKGLLLTFDGLAVDQPGKKLFWTMKSTDWADEIKPKR